MCKQITHKLILHIIYIYLNVCKQMIHVQLLLLGSNSWNHLTVCKKFAQVRLKMLSTKWAEKSYIFDIYKQDFALNNL